MSQCHSPISMSWLPPELSLFTVFLPIVVMHTNSPAITDPATPSCHLHFFHPLTHLLPTRCDHSSSIYTAPLPLVLFQIVLRIQLSIPVPRLPDDPPCLNPCLISWNLFLNLALTWSSLPSSFVLLVLTRACLPIRDSGLCPQNVLCHACGFLPVLCQHRWSLKEFWP